MFDQIQTQATVAPLVVDSADFLQQPGAYLQRLCDYIGVPFSSRMLSWPAGKRDSDGVWAEHWYNQVWASTGFKQSQVAELKLAPHLQEVYDEAQPLYERLFAYCVQIG